MLNKIIEVCEKLEREKNESKRIALSEVFNILYCFLTVEEKSLIDKEYSHLKISYKNKLYLEDRLMDNYDIHLNCFDKIKEKYNKKDINFKYYELMPLLKLSEDKIIDICNNILGDIGDNYYRLFNEILNKDNIYSAYIKDGNGLCINNIVLKDSYIFLDSRIDDNSISVNILMHEFGHAYENRFMSSMNMKQQLNRYYDIFGEVSSSFFERIAIDYCIKNHIYLDDFHRILNDYYEQLFINFDELNFVIKDILEDKMGYNILGQYFYMNKTVYENENLQFNSTYTYLSGDYHNSLNYGYGSLIAEYFFDIYKKDKKEGLKKFHDFLSNQYLLLDREMFDSIELDNNDFSFLEDGLKENSSYMRKKYKW